MKEEFEKNGYYVLRGVLTEAEVDRLARPIRAAFREGDYDTYHKGPAYPAPGIHSMGPRVLQENPEIAGWLEASRLSPGNSSDNSGPTPEVVMAAVMKIQQFLADWPEPSA